LSYANQVRPAALYEEVFRQVPARCQATAPGHKFRFKNKLLSLDSTGLELCASLFDWARFRQTKGAVKLHRLLDHDGCGTAVKEVWFQPDQAGGPGAYATKPGHTEGLPGAGGRGSAACPRRREQGRSMRELGFPRGAPPPRARRRRFRPR
jgi:hypothetical protein